MKITIINPSPDEEEEIIIKCRVLTDDINHLICKLKTGDRKITGYDAKGNYSSGTSGYFLILRQRTIRFLPMDKRMFMKLKKNCIS